MSTKEKACLNCKNIYEEEKCPKCGETQYSESFKGEIEVFNHQNSFIAKKLKINSNGKFSIKVK